MKAKIDSNKNKFQSNEQETIKTAAGDPTDSKKSIKFINEAVENWPSWTTQSKNSPQNYQTITHVNKKEESDTQSVSNMSETTQDTQKANTTKTHWKDKIMYA